MAELGTNKLLPILGGVAAVILLVVVVKVGFFNDGPQKVPSTLRTTLSPPGDEPDADTPADTIRALQGELARVKEAYSATQRSNAELMEENKRLTQDARTMRSEMRTEMSQEIEESEQRQAAKQEQVISRLSQGMERLKRLMDKNPKRRTTQSTQEGVYSDIPVGFGLDRLTGRDVVWLTPLDSQPDESGSLIPAALRGRSTDAQPAALREEPADRVPEAFFTIPNLSSLVGSTSFTAIIGRVPIGGQVRDPIPFRVLVGRDNLAASGLRVPNEIVGMVFEGTAVGDWTLSCAEGSLHTATFVFADGTIRTVGTAGGGNNAGPNAQSDRLGYIADKFGTPCISGRKISNWAQLTALRVGLRTGSAAAQAAAASETTTVISGVTGAISSAVDGDKGRFVLGRTVAEGIDEVDRAIAERLSNQFDAIFVANGQEVGLMIQKEIAIDYDPLGRKLDHAANTLGTRRSSYLD